MSACVRILLDLFGFFPIKLSLIQNVTCNCYNYPKFCIVLARQLMQASLHSFKKGSLIQGPMVELKQKMQPSGCLVLRRERLVNLSHKTLIFCLILLFYSISVTLLSSKALSEICNQLLFSNLYANISEQVLSCLFELISISVS